MKRVVMAFLAALVFSVSGAYAADGFSVGGSVGNANIEIDDNGVDFDDSDIGWKVFAAYQFNDNFAIEGGYVDFGEPEDDVAGINASVEADGFDVFAVGILPTSEDVDIFGKIGFISWDADIEAGGLSDSDDGEDLALGAGVRWNVNEQFGLRGEFEWFDIEDSDAVWLLSIGGEIRFK